MDENRLRKINNSGSCMQKIIFGLVFMSLAVSLPDIYDEYSSTLPLFGELTPFSRLLYVIEGLSILAAILLRILYLAERVMKQPRAYLYLFIAIVERALLYFAVDVLALRHGFDVSLRYSVGRLLGAIPLAFLICSMYITYRNPPPAKTLPSEKSEEAAENSYPAGTEEDGESIFPAHDVALPAEEAQGPEEKAPAADTAESPAVRISEPPPPSPEEQRLGEKLDEYRAKYLDIPDEGAPETLLARFTEEPREIPDAAPLTEEYLESSMDKYKKLLSDSRER